MVEVSMIL